MPNVTRKHHIIKYAPSIQRDNVGVVHHMVAYGCFHPNPDLLAGKSYLCYNDAITLQVLRCRFPVAVWTIGGEDLSFPDNVGLSIGGSGDPSLLILETHYDNPELKSGIDDSSGITMWYTPQLRSHDAGVFMFGNDGFHQMVTPPGVAQYTVTGVCHSNCTAQMIPTSGVNVFATLLHTHLLGRQIRLRHFRGDKEIGDFGRDDQYDFDYQEIQVFNPTRTMKPGDTIVTECIYDSSARRQVTFGGLDTTDEMCQGFLLYYPKVELNYCFSNVDFLGQISALKDAQLSSLAENSGGAIPDLTSALQNVEWTPSMRELLQRAQTQANLTYMCGSAESGQYINVTSSPFPSNLKFAANPDLDCFPTASAAVVCSAGQVSTWLTVLTWHVAGMILSTEP